MIMEASEREASAKTEGRNCGSSRRDRFAIRVRRFRRAFTEGLHGPDSEPETAEQECQRENQGLITHESARISVLVQEFPDVLYKDGTEGNERDHHADSFVVPAVSCRP